jgi:hypothetical protein
MRGDPMPSPTRIADSIKTLWQTEPDVAIFELPHAACSAAHYIRFSLDTVQQWIAFMACTTQLGWHLLTLAAVCKCT